MISFYYDIILHFQKLPSSALVTCFKFVGLCASYFLGLATCYHMSLDEGLHGYNDDSRLDS